MVLHNPNLSEHPCSVVAIDWIPCTDAIVLQSARSIGIQVSQHIRPKSKQSHPSFKAENTFIDASVWSRYCKRYRKMVTNVQQQVEPHLHLKLPQ